MSRIYIPIADMEVVNNVLKQLFKEEKAALWYALRIALSLSLEDEHELEEQYLDKDSAAKKEFQLSTVTGLGKRGKQGTDYTDTYRALLSVLHDQDLFANEEQFLRYLKGHICRGLQQLRECTAQQQDIYSYLRDRLFSPEPTDSAIEEEGNTLQAELEKLGIPSTIPEKQLGPRMVRYLLRLETAKQFEAIAKNLEALTASLGLRDRKPHLAMTSTPNLVAMDIPRDPSAWHNVTAHETYNKAMPLDNIKLPIIPGVGVLGEPILFDLVDAPHLLVGGTTGSGKSVCLRAILYGLIRAVPPTKLILCLIDPKATEYAPSRACLTSTKSR